MRRRFRAHAGTAVVKPVTRHGGTAFGRALRDKAAGAILDKPDLPPGYHTVAQNTDALIIERMPIPPRIESLKNREFLFGE